MITHKKTECHTPDELIFENERKPDMDVATKIRAFLEKHEIPQLALSEKTHISPAKLSLSLSNKRKLSLDEYQTI